ncbi:MAG: T9SS type A sorting domain-containing protein, partial [Bacteroidales bacterium]|nr:T9SS type A sorting domain-containing protein [Bacteroidales bacterium]
FPDNASVLAVVSVDGEEVCGETVELGAFVNGECRGSVRLEYDMDYGRCYAWLTVTATDGEEVGFRMYDEATGETSLNSTTRMTFQADAVVGDFDTPLVLDFAKAQGTSPSPTLKAYPNPVHRNEAIALQLPNGTTVTEVVVTDILGRTICRETANATILKGIPEPGVYNLEIRTEDGNLHHGKIIVN